MRGGHAERGGAERSGAKRGRLRRASVREVRECEHVLALKTPGPSTSPKGSSRSSSAVSTHISHREPQARNSQPSALVASSGRGKRYTGITSGGRSIRIIIMWTNSLKYGQALNTALICANDCSSCSDTSSPGFSL